ncbi:hypothetical protein D1818_23585 [Aquimarina sp. BL5]|uniref:hypothetical protein n=1 Tax=Aquimarina sp. BL5 TaxID=1714860 RepID=UPI000E4C6D83|nr:hypothetical protein [Aquimarina sp. BL5]AXT53661.1 hypothetical protein D1818_23585 [Aquimarina sp. BL5]RKN02815.1 hypothetical protein D7036_15805 [Aquimarina sp. BL5]
MKTLKLFGLFFISLIFFNCSNDDDELFLEDASLSQKGSLHSNIDWTGTWNSTYGALRLVERGELIYGDYDNIGVIYGYRHYINSKEYFEGTFENYQLNRKGIIRFEMNDQNYNNVFTGNWIWNNATRWYNWNGSKTSKREPVLQSFYNVKGRIMDNSTFQQIQNPISVEVFQDGIRHFSTLSENGLYTLQLPKGFWELRVTDPSYNNFSRVIEVKENYDYNNYFTQNIFLNRK